MRSKPSRTQSSANYWGLLEKSQAVPKATQLLESLSHLLASVSSAASESLRTLTTPSQSVLLEQLRSETLPSRPEELLREFSTQLEILSRVSQKLPQPSPVQKALLPHRPTSHSGKKVEAYKSLSRSGEPEITCLNDMGEAGNE